MPTQAKHTNNQHPSSQTGARAVLEYRSAALSLPTRQVPWHCASVAYVPIRHHNTGAVLVLSLGVPETAKFVARMLRPYLAPECQTWSENTIFSLFTTQITQRSCQVKCSQQIKKPRVPGYKLTVSVIAEC